MVEILPHKGTVVIPITLNDIEELYQTREFLEGLAFEKSLSFSRKEDNVQLSEILI